MRVLALVLFLLLGNMGITSCQFHQIRTLNSTNSEKIMTELPTIRIKNDIDENYDARFGVSGDDNIMKQSIDAGTVGTLVRVIGKYRQVDVRYIQDPPPEYKGHVLIVLDDGGKIFFYPPWHSKAIRSSDEIAQFENKRVVVVGKILRRLPSYPRGSASIVAPCLVAIESIEIAPL
jgi:hypothetical protein